MDRPKVGVAVILIKDGKVLVGRRKNSHGDGTWCFAGGHMEGNESFEDTARREALEETGVKIKNIRFAAVTNDIFEKEGKHYITVFMVADYDSGEPKVMEPDRHETWNWFEWDDIPKPMFLPIENLIRQGYKPLK